MSDTKDTTSHMNSHQIFFYTVKVFIKSAFVFLNEKFYTIINFQKPDDEDDEDDDYEDGSDADAGGGSSEWSTKPKTK